MLNCPQTGTNGLLQISQILALSQVHLVSGTVSVHTAVICLQWYTETPAFRVEMASRVCAKCIDLCITFNLLFGIRWIMEWIRTGICRCDVSINIVQDTGDIPINMGIR